MAIAAIAFSLSSPSSPSNFNLNLNFHNNHRSLSHLPHPLTLTSTTKPFTPFSLSSNLNSRSPSLIRRHFPLRFSGANSVGNFSGGENISGEGNFSDGGNFGGGDGGGGGRRDDDHDDDENGENKNKKDVFMVLSEIGRSLETLPKDMVSAIEEGKIPVDVVRRYLELEKSPFLRWLLQFGGFKERLLADDLFLAKVGMECGVGIFTKTAAEYEKRRENFFNELEVVFADWVMAVIADFMLVYLPAPTFALRQPLALNAGPISKFFHNCPDNAFQIALGGASYSLMQRIGAIVRNGSKLFAVGTASSLVGTSITNAVINARKAVDKSAADEVETVPILSTSVAYGVYMAISSNLRYQIVAGIIEQRLLEPMFHKQKLLLSAFCFAVRTGNTFVGSLLWVDYARWIGIQKAHGEEHA
ncbi:protein RETICULATA-RELATED 4, chloroplastic-like [Beta vulgaris subsp. vulgaris]|uniref:protein RETICULATA-RELATED 4, chloroplastic-like n=1 Tax=Beta vulgaris subsp. vulgaris TaxID=3555 RepID=UPI0025474B3E|nr:protein RETICULATA-RELATED 4, chloroplastic-like [Beta vulgaris subsp. vulgaris]